MIAITPMPPTISAIDEMTTSARNVPWLIRSQIFSAASCVARSKSLASSSFRLWRMRITDSTSAIAAARSASSRGMRTIMPVELSPD